MVPPFDIFRRQNGHGLRWVVGGSYQNSARPGTTADLPAVTGKVPPSTWPVRDGAARLSPSSPTHPPARSQLYLTVT